jgi:gas vesicle protein
MYPKTDNTLSLIGGAVLGAAAMYLLDPDSGERRRRDLADRTGDATARAGEAIGPMWERVSDTARNFGSSLATGASAFGHGAMSKFDDLRGSASDAAGRLGDRASDQAYSLRDQLSEHASNLGDQLSAHASGLRGRASDLGSSLADSFRHYGRRARKAASNAAPAGWFHEEESHVGRYVGAGLGTLILGAAAMYFLDPTRGRTRRTRAVEQATSICRRTGQAAWQIGKDLRNRGMGYAHETRGYFEPEDAVSAEKLLHRIRAEMGHVVSHAGAIQVMTDNHGRVTLHGKVLASEADRLISTIKGVTGVTELINLLSVKETEQQMHEADTSAAGQPKPQM